ncbi:MAG: MT-A70 family methyltransferase [Candidatus Odinarchaeota archaeon]
MVLHEKDDVDYYYNVYRENPTQENLDQLIKYRPQDKNDAINKKGILDLIRKEKKQQEWKEYEFHEYANKFRLMNNDEYNGLKGDIKKYGLHTPLFLFEGKILDGRNRYNVCKELEIEPKYLQFKGTKEEAFYFVISENVHRRHLNPAERAEIGLVVLEQEEIWAKERQNQAEKLERNNLGQFIDQPLTTSDVVSGIKKRESTALETASKKIGVGRETLKTAKKVKELEKEHPKIKKKWEQAKKGKTTIKAVRTAINEIEKEKKPKPKTPEGKFGLIYADPPWQYNFTSSPTRTIEKEYSTMTLKEICNLKIPSTKDCILFLWCPAPKLYPEGLTVIKEWGFTYKTCMVWIKDKIGMGYYGRNRHELLLIATKGNPGIPIPKNRPDSVIEAPRTEHSKKPEIVYELIEKMYPNKEKIELFARNERKNWKSWGNEIESK